MSVCMLYVGAMTTTLYPSQYADKLLKGDQSSKYFNSGLSMEVCVGNLGIHDICHLTSRDIGYYPFFFQGYGILCSIFSLLSGILNI